MENPAAWHPDPTGRHDHRWWDGERWTEHVADAGQASIDPLEGGTTPQDAGSATGAAEVAGADAAGTSPSGDATSGGAAQDDRPGTAEQPAQSWEQPGGWEQPSSGQPGEAGTGWGSSGTPPAWGQQAGQPTWQQPQQSWPQATPTGEAPPTGTSGLAITALILGILSLVFFWMPVLGGLGALIAIVFGILGRSQAKKRPMGGAGMGLAGIITGSVALLLNILVTLALFGAFGSATGFFRMFGDYAECMEEHNDQEFCEQQIQDDLPAWLRE